MTASTRSQSRQPRSPKRTSPRRQRRPGRPPRSARQRNSQVSRPTAPPPPPLCGRPKALAQARAFCLCLKPETDYVLFFVVSAKGKTSSVPGLLTFFFPPPPEADNPHLHLPHTSSPF